MHTSYRSTSYRSLEGRHGDPGPGTVHDSSGSLEFMQECIRMIRAARPGIIIEMLMASALFSDQTAKELQGRAIEFTPSVPFGRFAELKQII